MLAINLISDELPTLHLDDKVDDGLRLMDEFKISHLPIIDEDQTYIGMISESDLLDVLNPEDKINEHHFNLNPSAVIGSQHPFDILKLISDFDLSYIPVVNNEKKFLGGITLQQLIISISQMSSMAQPGSIVILELNPKDYSMAEIAQIVEGNDAKILSSFINRGTDVHKIEVTLKVNKTNIDGIIQSFKRYSYTIKASFQNSIFEDDLRDRYAALMNFLRY